jgi:hypothetical protein
MGTPVSWSVLSLCHYMIIRELGLSKFAICGDDAILRLTAEGLVDYHRLLGHFGFTINIAKTFVAPLHGVFCEVLYRANKKNPNHLFRVFTVPMRAFAPEDEEWTTNIQSTFNDVAHHVSLKRLNTATKTAFSEAYASCRRYKVNPYLPLWCGGIGMPPPRSDRTLTRDEAAVVRWVSTHGTSFPIPSATIGTNLNALGRLSQGIKWSVSTLKHCPHLDSVMNELRLGPTLLDLSNGTYERRRFRMQTVIRSMSRRFKMCPRAPVPEITRLTYLSLYGIELTPSRESVRSCIGHDCATYEHLHSTMWDSRKRLMENRTSFPIGWVERVARSRRDRLRPTRDFPSWEESFRAVSRAP